MTDQDDGSEPCTCAPCRERALRLRARTWRRLKRIDLTATPVPVMRYVGILLVAIAYLVSCAVIGHALTPLNDWLWAAVLGGFLLLPDVAGFGVAGIRVDLKQTQDEVTRLKQEVNAQARASSLAITAVGVEAIPNIIKSLERGGWQVAADQASGPARQWSGVQPGHSTATPAES